MKPHSVGLLLAATAFATATYAADPPAIPAEITAMLLEHRGAWRTEGWIIEGEKRTPLKSRWECKAAVNGIGNVCTWYHEWVDQPHDTALQIMGYDPTLKVLRMQRVTDSGISGQGAEVTVRGNTMTVVRESRSDAGKPRMMRNEIVVTKPGEWDQRITFDEDGKRVREWRMTQRRLSASETMPASPSAKPAPEIPADVLKWWQDQRGTWRSEGLIVKGEERTPAYATWECRAAVNGIGNVCTWNHEWTDRPHDSALEIAGYDPRLKMVSITRVGDNGIMGEPVTVAVKGNKVTAERQITENGKPTVMRNEVVAVSRDERSQRMSVEVEGRVVREFIITHRRVN
jgi:hypothetical protein